MAVYTVFIVLTDFRGKSMFRLAISNFENVHVFLDYFTEYIFNNCRNPTKIPVRRSRFRINRTVKLDC